jgi:pimeloyl-ACP methyl ester carboxylesterase
MVNANERIRACSVLGCIMTVAVLSGCQGRRLLLNEQKLDQGLVIVLPGIDGLAPYNVNACKALCEDRFDMAVELYDWTLPFGLLLNQCAVLRNRLAANELASRIVRYRKEYPNRPVFLIGHSGGTAIAVWAAEALPDGERIDRIVLLASSLSPGYDLSKAMGHTRLGIVSFYSDRDGALLGAGTVLLGTMDGQHTEAAGKVGFRPLRHGEESYGGLTQIAWEPGMAAAGHDGGHFGYTARGFMKSRVRPWVIGAAWGDGLANARATPPEEASGLRTVRVVMNASK